MTDGPPQEPTLTQHPAVAAAPPGPPPGWWLASDGQWYPPPQPGAPVPGYQQPSYQWSPPPQPGAPLPGYQQYPSARPTNGLAVASMVLGILWLYWVGSILALIFGYAAKNQIRQSGHAQTGSGMATAGIVLGWIGVGFFVLFAVLVAARSA